MSAKRLMIGALIKSAPVRKGKNRSARQILLYVRKPTQSWLSAGVIEESSLNLNVIPHCQSRRDRCTTVRRAEVVLGSFPAGQRNIPKGKLNL